MKNVLLRRTWILIASAIGLALAFSVISFVFVNTQAGQALDQRAFFGAELGQRTVAPVALSLLDAIPITGVAIALIMAVLVTMTRGNWSVFAVATAAAALANIATQLFKNVFLVRPDLGVPGYALNSLPSGHTTLAASSVLIIFLVSSQRTRPLIAGIGAIFITGVGIATMANQWHRPSDVVAALLIVAFFGCLAGLVMIRSRFTEIAPRRDLLSRFLLLLALPCAGIALATLLLSVFEPFAYVGSAAGIATCALLLAAAANHAFRFIR